MRRGQLVFQQLNVIGCCCEEKTVEPFKIAFDFFARGNLVDFLDRSGMTFCCVTRALGAVKFFNLHVAVVVGVTEMSGRAAGHATANHAVIQNDY